MIRPSFTALIGDKSSKGDTNIITKSVKIGCVIESSYTCGPHVYANAFLRKRSYATVKHRLTHMQTCILLLVIGSMFHLRPWNH